MCKCEECLDNVQNPTAMQQMAMPQTAMPQVPPIQAAMQPLAMQMTDMPSVVPPSTMTARPNQFF